MKKMVLLILSLVLIMLLMPAYGLEPVNSAEESETAKVSFDISELADEPMFIDTEADANAMQLIILKTDDRVRLAFNTCQACQGSPWAWFEYLRNGILQCQNCHQTFGMEIVGTEEAKGCCPITISDFEVEENLLIMPETVLTDNAVRFKNWKKVGQ